MADAGTETDRPFRWVLHEMGQDRLGTPPVAEGCVQFLPDVASAGEPDLGIADVVGDAAVGERDQPSEADSV